MNKTDEEVDISLTILLVLCRLTIANNYIKYVEGYVGGYVGGLL
jgi:hypothetical protein